MAPAAFAETDPRALLEAMPARYAIVHSYTAVCEVQERVDGSLRPAERIAVKFATPFRVYMRWLAGPGEGRQALFALGEHDGRVLVRETGLLGLVTLRLDPHGRLAMLGRRRAITEGGIGELIERTLGDLAREGAALRDGGRTEVLGRAARLVELLRPNAGGTLRVWIDEALGLPIQVEDLDASGARLEFNAYGDLRTNVTFDASDFAPDNPAYGF